MYVRESHPMDDPNPNEPFLNGLATIGTMVIRFTNWLASIDWVEVVNTFNDAVRRHVEAGRKLAMKGWTIPAWMGISEPLELCEMSEAELDTFFTAEFTKDDYRILRERIGELISYGEMLKWTPLLEEVQDSIIEGRHRIAIPALMTILEGYAVSEVLRADGNDVRKTDLFKLFEKIELHKADDLRAMPAISNLTFLQMLFEPHPFDQAAPERINRHWVMHGRADCDWTPADAFRLINALETLHWLWEHLWSEHWAFARASMSEDTK